MKDILSGIALVAAMVALLCGYLGWLGWQSEQRQASWPTVAGQVLSSGIVRERQDMSLSQTSNATVERWVFTIAYAFTVEGRSHTGHRFSNTEHVANVGSSTTPPTALRALAAAYPAGRAVTVHYSRADPDHSVLELDRSASRVLGGIAAVAALVGAAIMVWRFTSQGGVPGN